jgi:hypothetical protein
MRMRALVLAALGLASCGWELDVPSFRTIDRTRVLGTKAEVVAFGPLWPERIGFDPDGAAIVEAMPGDRVRLSALMVAANGRALPSADFDVLWFQCSQGCDLQAPRCQDIEWTTDVDCELGRAGELEFEVPPVGPLALDEVDTLAIIALDPDIDAERCRQLVLDPGPDLSRCGVVYGDAQIGPRWALLVELAEAGIEVALDFPIFEIPWLALLQPANRAPVPSLPTWTDADTGEPITGDPLRVRAGQRLHGEGPVWRAADSQPYVRAVSDIEGETYVFFAALDILDSEWFVSAGLRLVVVEPEFVDLAVEDDAEPGPQSAVMRFSDTRYVQNIGVSVDFRVVEFEVVP